MRTERVVHRNCSLQELMRKAMQETKEPHSLHMVNGKEFDKHEEVIEAGGKLPKDDYEYIGKIINHETEVERFFHVRKK